MRTQSSAVIQKKNFERKWEKLKYNNARKY